MDGDICVIVKFLKESGNVIYNSDPRHLKINILEDYYQYITQEFLQQCKDLDENFKNTLNNPSSYPVRTKLGRWIKITRKFNTQNPDEMIYIFDDISSIYCSDHKMAFLSNIFEIITPINGIIGMTSLLADTRLDDEQKKYIDTLKESGYNLMQNINDILDFLKLEYGKVSLELTNFSLRECIENACNIVTIKANDKGINIEFNVDEDCPDLLLGDYHRIKQILVNLLYNSITFTDTNGRVTGNVNNSSVKTVDTFTDTVELLFSVIDTGSSLESDIKPLLFKSYNHLSGTGLGLSICKSLCDLMGGDMFLEQSFDKGSDFKFNIKVKLSHTCSNTVLSKEDLTILKGKTVLVVDNDITSRVNICGSLMTFGVICIPCGSGEEALLFCNNKVHFDLVILDILLPRQQSGTEIARKIKAINDTIPILGLSSTGDKFKNIESNLFKYLFIKPIKEDKLLSTCHNMIRDIAYSGYYNHDTSSVSILIDEDLYLNKLVLKTLLNKLGYTNLTIVDNGKEAIDKLKEESYDICFIDIKTPIKTGYDVINFIKQNNYKTISVVLTGLISNGEDFIKQGFDYYLSKPIYLDTLHSLLDEISRRNL